MACSTLSLHPGRWAALVVLVAGQFMFVVDAFVVNVAIPSIRAELHASGGQVEAVIAIYQMTYAAVLITGGRLGDRFGRKPLFVLGLAGFTASSAWCGLAPSAAILILARAVQGATAGLMVPQVLASIQVLFAPSERARAFGFFGGALGLGGTAGLILGGGLVSLDLCGLGWRAAFLVNVPFGIAGLFAGLILVPAIESTRSERLDLGGASLLAAGILPLVGTVLFGRELDWPRWLAAPAIAGIVVLAAFAKLEIGLAAKGGSPLLDPSWLRDRGFATGLAVTCAAYAGMTGFLFVLTLFLQEGSGYSPLEAALTTVPLAVAFLLASRCAARTDTARGAALIMAGAAIMGISLLIIAALVALAPASAALVLVVPLALYGFGQGLVLAPLVNTVLASAHAVPAGAASGLLVTVQQIAGAVGIAAIGLVYFSARTAGGDHFAFSISACALAGSAALAVAILIKFKAVTLAGCTRRDGSPEPQAAKPCCQQ